MRGKLIILYCISLFFCPVYAAGQSLGVGDVYAPPPENTAAPEDSLEVADMQLFDESETIIIPDTVLRNSDIPVDSLAEKEAFKPDPEKVIWLGAIIPGYGQIVNRKYWKLPIVYGGFMGCAFAVTWFSGEYQFYKTAYRDMTDTDPTTNSHMEYLNNRGVSIEQLGGEASYRDKLKSYQDNYRRYRDLSILFSVIYYGLTILEAYVDAQLYDFDISPDLSMRFQPAIINNDVVYAKETNNYDVFGQTKAFGQSNAVGIQWSIRLK